MLVEFLTVASSLMGGFLFFVGMAIAILGMTGEDIYCLLPLGASIVGFVQMVVCDSVTWLALVLLGLEVISTIAILVVLVAGRRMTR